MKCPNCGRETNNVVCSCGYRFAQSVASVQPTSVKRLCTNCGAAVIGNFVLNVEHLFRTLLSGVDHIFKIWYSYNVPQKTSEFA